MNLKALGLIGPMLVLATCGSSADLPPDIAAAQPPTPQARCDAALAQMPVSDHPRLVAVFESTALEVAEWNEGGLMPGHARAGKGMSPFRKHPIDESVASCYYDGTFVFSGPIPPPMPGAPSASPRVFERLLLVIDSSGDAIESDGGSKENLPLIRPMA